MSKNLSPTKQHRLLRYEEDYRQLKKELLQVGHVLQGSVATRWIECGNASCRCHDGPQSRHGLTTSGVGSIKERPFHGI